MQSNCEELSFATNSTILGVAESAERAFELKHDVLGLRERLSEQYFRSRYTWWFSITKHAGGFANLVGFTDKALCFAFKFSGEGQPIFWIYTEALENAG